MAPIDYYFRVPYADISERWKAAEAGTAHPPWQQPPQCGARVLERIFLLTVGGGIYELPYQEFYRIMVRDNLLKLVFENGREESILEFYGSEESRSHTAKEPFSWMKKYAAKPTAVPEAPPTTNVLPFKPKKA